MPINSRTKGASGEREVARILADELGIQMVRNLAQARNGGSDLIGLPGWSVEVKRAKAVTAGMVGEWWTQAEAQAIREGKRPALAYRADRQPWRVALRLGDLIPALPHWQGPDWLAHVSIPAFAAINREWNP